MTARTLPTIGNMVVTERPDAVEIRLRSNDGSPVALFTYAELPALIETLRAVRQPAAVDDIEDMLA